METETQTVVLRDDPADSSLQRIEVGRLWLGAFGTRAWLVTRDDLQQIVQAAYDQHGILAEPSYDLEAKRAGLSADEFEAERQHAMAQAGWSV